MISRLVAAALGGALLLSACSGGGEPKLKARPRPAPSTPQVSATPTPTPPKPATLTGRTDRKDGPILAVKIDNTRMARPQRGLTKADVVYIEQVEGGVTRLAAIFSSQRPKYVGPVRSARISDIELLRQYGTVGLIYSGSQRKLTPKLRAAKLKLASFDDSRRGYARSSNRPSPYNVVGTMSPLLKRVGKVDRPKRVGYAFGPAPSGGKRAQRFTASFPNASVSGSWSSSRKKWVLYMDGRASMAAEGGQLGATTFIVQYVTITGSAYKDINGVVTPNSRTVGQGKALIFREGKVYEGRWSRGRSWQPTKYTINGETAVLARGPIWVALLGRSRPVSVN